MRNIILGTAGHIDHGKSALVKALTGIDPDRLKEEKDRGMTIDLGFADITYADGLTVGIVDVPGHERLIRNMLAGAGGIDFVLFVIAADESIMPQSREHLHICDLLKIKAGMIVITKADLVEEDWLEFVKDDAQDFVKGTFLEKAGIVPVSSKTFFNIDLLKEKIKEEAIKVEPKSTKGLFRLPIDRAFTLKGFGTVVTGTAFSGSISVGDAVEILPGGRKSKIRGLHSHGKSITTAYAGQRVAINLQGIDKEELQRGDCVVVPERFIPAKMIDASLELLADGPSLKNRDIIHLHMGTSEVMARVVLYGRNNIKPGEDCYCQFRLQEPIIAMSGDRYIIRRFSPLDTIGGGEVLDPLACKMSHKRSLDSIHLFTFGTVLDKIALKVKRAGIQGIKLSLIAGWIREEVTVINDSIRQLREKGILQQWDDVLFHNENIATVSSLLRVKVEDFHKENSLRPGIQKEELRSHLSLEPKIFNYLISSVKEVVMEKEFVRIAHFKPALSQGDEAIRNKILEVLEKAGTRPPRLEDLCQLFESDLKYMSDILKLMAKEGSIVRINDSFYITNTVCVRAIKNLADFFSRKSEMTVRDFKDTFPTSGKYSIHFLEYLDSIRYTKRVGNVRKLFS
jgi:selenocysteine-specific elongation factor